MKGLNPRTLSVNQFTQSVNSKPYDSNGVCSTVSFESLISLTMFLNEVGLPGNDFMRYRKDNRVEGLYLIAGKVLIDRRRINIFFKRNGVAFRRWLELGGRLGPVNVKQGIAYDPVVRGDK